MGCSYDYIRGLRSRSMHRASNFSNVGQGAINLIVTNRGGQSNRNKGHSRLFNSIRISLLYMDNKIFKELLKKICGNASPTLENRKKNLKTKIQKIDSKTIRTLFSAAMSLSEILLFELIFRTSVAEPSKSSSDVTEARWNCSKIIAESFSSVDDLSWIVTGGSTNFRRIWGTGHGPFVDIF